MTNSTKELFDAPWEVQQRDDCYSVWGENLEIANEICYRKDANRISHLPELYDALDKAAPYCPMWLTNEIVTLLQKVRDGE